MCPKPYTNHGVANAKALEPITLGLSTAFVVEPVDGIEPTTCCLQNGAASFSASIWH
jgi:hypothetical protein